LDFSVKVEEPAKVGGMEWGIPKEFWKPRGRTCSTRGKNLGTKGGVWWKGATQTRKKEWRGWENGKAAAGVKVQKKPVRAGDEIAPPEHQNRSCEGERGPKGEGSKRERRGLGHRVEVGEAFKKANKTGGRAKWRTRGERGLWKLSGESAHGGALFEQTIKNKKNFGGFQTKHRQKVPEQKKREGSKGSHPLGRSQKRKI